MGKVESLLRSEIARLARKEVRTTCAPIAREVRRLRRAVAQLTRTTRSLDRVRGELERRRRAESGHLAAKPEEVQKARFSAGLIKKLRTRLGITQAELAKLAHVSPASVAFWEQGRSRPTAANRGPLVALRKVGRREARRLLEAT